MQRDGETVDITATLPEDEMFKKKKKKRLSARLGMHQMRCTKQGNLSTPGSNRDGRVGVEDDCMIHPVPYEADQMCGCQV